MQGPPATAAQPNSRRVACVAGFGAALAFCGISTASDGFYIDFHPPFNRIGAGEANLWLGSSLLLFPAACLLGYGYQQPIGRALSWLHHKVHAMTRRESALALLSLTLLAVSLARLSNALVLLELPVTDDEWAARFGGEVLATARLSTTLPFEKDAFPWLFTFIDGAQITSLDWLGVQIPWLLSTLTGTGNWVFAVAAAIPVPCVAWLLSRRLGASWGAAGALLFLTSPMAFALSASTHGHLSSRAWVAVTLALFIVSRENKTRLVSLALGLSLGLALICRPFESCSLLAPLFVCETWSALRHGPRAERVRWMLLVVGLLIPVGSFLLHTYALTGGFVPARHHPLAAGAMPTHESSYWVRFGSNSAFNALRLGVWFAGPLGIALFAAGVMTDRFTRLLGLGILVGLLVGLFHDNYGIHALGPIHYSECVVPLTIIAVHGLARLTDRLRELGTVPVVPAAIAAVWMLFGLVTFNLIHAAALHAQALTQSIVYEMIEGAISPEQRPAVLFAPTFGEVWTRNAEFAKRGSWVFEWRRPRPDFSDDILILHERSPSAAASVRAAFPGRHFFHFQESGPGKHLAIVPDP
ncbi:MAG: hypothetical protein JWN48_2292 [Myxococcaceae bacterium]|nr:hypothetical protein [Myxococcaceae bacterium]